MKKFLPVLTLIILLFASCSSDDAPVVSTLPNTPATNFSSGDADFSNFVSVGNSLTAGFSDSALFVDGQTNSFPNMMASSFEEVGGGDFSIPFMADNLGGATFGGQGNGTTEISNVLSGAFNNMGVPGAKSFHLLAPGYGNLAGVPVGTANPYFARFASSPNATIIEDAIAQAPTFFSLWIGNNDILSFATSGGTGVDQRLNPDPSTYGINDITSPVVFEQVYNSILRALTDDGANGVVANIPDVTSIPFFTTVPYNPIPLDAEAADLANMSYASYNGSLQLFQLAGELTAEEVAQRTIEFSEGENNAVVIIDENLTFLTTTLPDGSTSVLPKIRQTTSDDLLVLTSIGFIGTLSDPNNLASINGVTVPLSDQWVLTPEEQTLIKQATTTFNQTIANAVATFDLAFVDANRFLDDLGTSGFDLADGSTVTAAFATGGGFSLDGVHPSPRGYALLANKFMDEIEIKYGAKLPKISPEDFIGVYLE